MPTEGERKGARSEQEVGVDGIDRFVADARIDEAACSRGRERWLRQQAAEEATIEGICRDLGERSELVFVTSVAGTRHRGRIEALGEDYLAVRTADASVLVPFEGLHAIEVQDRAEPGERPLRDGLRLADVVADLALHRPTVRARSHSGDAIVGELRSGGRDVAAVRVGHGSRRTVYVRLSSLAELSVLSG